MTVRVRDVLAEADLPPDGTVALVVEGWHVLLVRAGDAVHAINNRCPHAAARLTGGPVRAGTIACPRHSARFDLATGKCVSAPYPAIRIFAAQTVAGRILVELPANSPGLVDLPIG